MLLDSSIRLRQPLRLALPEPYGAVGWAVPAVEVGEATGGRRWVWLEKGQEKHPFGTESILFSMSIHYYCLPFCFSGGFVVKLGRLLGDQWIWLERIGH